VSRRKIPKILIKPKNSRDTIIKSRVNKVTPIPRANRLSHDTNSHGEFFRASSHLMKDVIFVAYYTFNTPYEAEAVKLKASLKKLDLLHDVVAVPSITEELLIGTLADIVVVPVPLLIPSNLIQTS
jgi:hypothetical protein